jgi:hypothetical protein
MYANTRCGGPESLLGFQIPAIIGYGKHSDDVERETAAGENDDVAGSFQKSEEVLLPSYT